MERTSALQEIADNISRFGWHRYLVVGGGPTPRFSYSIGLSATHQNELVFAGGIQFSADALSEIFAEAVVALGLHKQEFQCGPHGKFTFRPVDASWASLLLLGALDFYQVKSIPALQIVPEKRFWTSDIPDMSRPWNPQTEPVWQWLVEPWPFKVLDSTTAVTNMAALKGGAITEAARWEDDCWEMFSGPGHDVSESEMTVVPIATLLALDVSLQPVLDLEIGEAIRRENGESAWQDWRSSN